MNDVYYEEYNYGQEELEYNNFRILNNNYDRQVRVNSQISTNNKRMPT